MVAKAWITDSRIFYKEVFNKGTESGDAMLTSGFCQLLWRNGKETVKYRMIFT